MKVSMKMGEIQMRNGVGISLMLSETLAEFYFTAVEHLISDEFSKENMRKRSL